MSTSNGFKLIGISIFLVVGLAACDKPGPAESASKAIDQTVDEAGNTVNVAANKTSAQLDEQGEKTGAVVDDAVITEKVKAAIFAEPGLKTLQISVNTTKGVVTLSGSVDSQLNGDQAKLLAGAVSGVIEVDNHLVLKSIN